MRRYAQRSQELLARGLLQRDAHAVDEGIPPSVRAGPKLVSIAILTLIGLHQNTHRLDWYSPRRVLSTHAAIKSVRPVGQPFRRVGNQAAVLSKLRFQVPNPSAEVRHEISLLRLLRFRRPF